MTLFNPDVDPIKEAYIRELVMYDNWLEAENMMLSKCYDLITSIMEADDIVIMPIGGSGLSMPDESDDDGDQYKTSLYREEDVTHLENLIAVRKTEVMVMTRFIENMTKEVENLLIS